jgi:hypothetical protein
LFVDRSCAGDEADLVYLPTLPLDRRVDGAAEGSVLVLSCFLGPDKVMFATIGHPLMLQDTEGARLIPCGWEDRYAIRPHPTETFLHDCLSWYPLLDSLVFSRLEGASHFTGSCRVPYSLLC